MFSINFYIIGEEVDQEIKDAVAGEPEIEDVPQENDEELSFDEELEDEEEDDVEEEDQEQGKITIYLFIGLF